MMFKKKPKAKPIPVLVTRVSKTHSISRRKEGDYRGESFDVGESGSISFRIGDMPGYGSGSLSGDGMRFFLDSVIRLYITHKNKLNDPPEMPSDWLDQLEKCVLEPES